MATDEPGVVIISWLGGDEKWGKGQGQSRQSLASLSREVKTAWQNRKFQSKPLWISEPPPGTYGVWDDDDKFQRASRRHNLMSREQVLFVKGERVKGNFKGGGEWFLGTIDKTRADGTYDINYDDGDTEEGVLPACIEKVRFGVRRGVRGV